MTFIAVPDTNVWLKRGHGIIGGHMASLDRRDAYCSDNGRWDITGAMSRSILLAFSLLAGTSVVAQTPEFTLQGLITVDKPTKSIRVVLQDPKEKNVEVASVDATRTVTTKFEACKSVPIAL